MIDSLRRILLFLSVATLSESFLSFGLLSLTANKLITLALLILVLFEIATTSLKLPANPKNLWMLVFMGAVFPSVATSYIFGVPVPDLLGGLLTPAAVVLFYYLLCWCVRSRKDLDLVIWGVVIGVGLTALSGILGIGRETGSYYARVGGLGGNPNLMATNCVMGLCLGFHLFLENPKLMRRLFLAGLMAIMVVAFAGTLSRAGFLAILAMGGFLLVRSRRLDILRWAIPVAIAVGLGLYLAAPERYFERIGTMQQEAQDLSELSLKNDRILGWYMGIKAFSEYPLTGVGLRSFDIYLWRHTDHRRVTPHSSYLAILALMGIVGFVPWIAVVALTWLDLSRAWAMARRGRRLGDPEFGHLESHALYLQTAFIAWLVAGLVSPFAFEKGQWMIYGLSTVVLHLTRQQLRARVAARDRAAGAEADDDRALPAEGGPLSSWQPRGV
jgi:O-antigen ligase